MKKAKRVIETLLSLRPTKGQMYMVTEKGSGGPLGGARKNPSQDYHIVKIELKGLQHVAQTVARDDYHIVRIELKGLQRVAQTVAREDYHVVKIELKVLLHDPQMVAENDFQDGHKRLFGFNS